MTIGSHAWDPEKFDYDEYFKDGERSHEWSPPHCSGCSRYEDDVRRVAGLGFRCANCVPMNRGKACPECGSFEHDVSFHVE